MSDSDRSHTPKTRRPLDDTTSPQDAEASTGEDVTESAKTSNDAAEMKKETTEEARAAEPSLEEQLQTALAERDTYYDRWMRAQAELENFRRRARKEREDALKYSTIPVVRDFLAAIDNLERALDAATTLPEDGAQRTHQQLIDGLQLVGKQFADILAKHGATPIEALKQPFDPTLHEAVAQVPTPDVPPMTVIEEVEKGYTVHDRVVRPTKVIVSGPCEESPPDADV